MASAPGRRVERTIRGRFSPAFHQLVDIVIEDLGDVGEIGVLVASRDGGAARPGPDDAGGGRWLEGRDLHDVQAALDAVAWADLPEGFDEQARDGIEIAIEVTVGPARRTVVVGSPSPSAQPELHRAIGLVLDLGAGGCRDARALGAIDELRRYL